MLSNKPYLVRAFYDWIVDSSCTPFIVINAGYKDCNIPDEYIENGEITLNVSPQAIRDLKILNEKVEFRASFSGVVHVVAAPIKSVLAIYAQENQEGMFFDYEEGLEEVELDNASLGQQPPPGSSSDAKRDRSHLRLVD